MDWSVVAAIAAAIVGLLVAVPAVRAGRAKATIDLQAAELAAEREARESQARRFEDQLRAQDERCQAREREMERRHVKEIGELRGMISALTPDFARTLARMLREEGVGA